VGAVGTILVEEEGAEVDLTNLAVIGTMMTTTTIGTRVTGDEGTLDRAREVEAREVAVTVEVVVGAPHKGDQMTWVREV